MLEVQRIRIYPELIPGVCAVRSLCRCSHLNSNSFVCVFAVCASRSCCLFCGSKYMRGSPNSSSFSSRKGKRRSFSHSELLIFLECSRCPLAELFSMLSQPRLLCRCCLPLHCVGGWDFCRTEASLWCGLFIAVHWNALFLLGNTSKLPPTILAFTMVGTFVS